LNKRGKQNRPSLAMWSTVLALALSASMAPRAKAATITVDENGCSLAFAIISANTDVVTGGCPAGAGPDIIDLQADVTLAADLPVVSTEVTIAGNNHTISGNDTVRVLYNAGGDLTITDTTITHGNTGQAGGGIYNKDGNLTLRNCTIEGNKAVLYGGGIRNHNYGSGTSITVTIADCTISGNTTERSGGGISDYSENGNTTLTINDSTISGNAVIGFLAGAGGGIDSYSFSSNGGNTTLTIKDSTISGNTGGGIRVNQTALTITNSTISDNTTRLLASGGGISHRSPYSSAPLTVTHSTISGNTADKKGGGIYLLNFENADLTLKGNLISGNQASEAGAELFIQATDTPILDGYNVLGHDSLTSAAAFSGIELYTTDVSATGDSANPFALNAILTPLADNGGKTKTQALVAGSPALDLAPKSECNFSPLSLDQRGSTRPSGHGCDAGSYEYKQSNLLFMVIPVISGASKR